VVAVVSQPDRPRGRGRKRTPSPVSALAEHRGLPLLRPETLGAPEVEATLRDLRPDLGVVVAFGQFIPRRIRQLPALGYCINAHASLLPRWRGATPIARAILAGDTLTGISVIRVEREMDAGAVARRRELAIGPAETAGELEPRLATLGAELVAEVIDEIAARRVEWQPQDSDGVTRAPKLEREETRLDFTQPAAALVLRVRALAPVPGARARLRGEPLRVLAARAETGTVDSPPGTVEQAEGSLLRIATGEGWLVPLRLQRPGGRPLDAADFLRGRPIPAGERLE
jgi:methionyl-tRNA formyltransferase